MVSKISNGAADLSTAVDIAHEIGVHKATINRIARTNDIGTFLGNQRVFSDADIAEIKRLCKVEKGNPNFVKKQ